MGQTVFAMCVTQDCSPRKTQNKSSHLLPLWLITLVWKLKFNFRECCLPLGSTGTCNVTSALWSAHILLSQHLHELTVLCQEQQLQKRKKKKKKESILWEGYKKSMCAAQAAQKFGKSTHRHTAECSHILARGLYSSAPIFKTAAYLQSKFWLSILAFFFSLSLSLFPSEMRGVFYFPESPKEGSRQCFSPWLLSRPLHVRFKKINPGQTDGGLYPRCQILDFCKQRSPD